MMSGDLTIATMTRARDEDEALLLVRSLRALDAHGIPMFIADGGSVAEFVGEIQQLPNANLSATRGAGLVAQVRASVRDAATHGTRFVLYTEPDKLDFFENH